MSDPRYRQSSPSLPSDVAIFFTLEVLTPFVGDDFGLHAHFRPVCLNHLRHAASIRVIRDVVMGITHRSMEKPFSRPAFSKASLFQDRKCSPERRRYSPTWLAGSGFSLIRPRPINRFDDGVFVHRVGQSLANFTSSSGFFCTLASRDNLTFSSRHFHQVDDHPLHAGDICRVRVRHHLAFVLLHSRVTHGSVRSNREDQRHRIFGLVPQ